MPDLQATAARDTLEAWRGMPRPGEGESALLVCHASLADRAAGALLEIGYDQLHLVAYGRAAADLPLPPGVVGHELAASGGGIPSVVRAGLGLLRALRRQRFAVALVAHPGLDVSRMRGPLLAFPWLVGARLVFAAGGPKGLGGPTAVGRPEAMVEVLRWAVLQSGSRVLAAVAARLAERLVRERPARVIGDGDVVYLRTDLELALAPLGAGGSAAHTAGIVDALERSGRPVRFWSTGAVTGVRGAGERRLPVLLRANVPVEIAELLSGLLQWFAGRRAPAPAFVYQRYSLNNLAGLLLARRWKVPLVLEANDSEALWRRQWSALQFSRLADATERLLLRSADRIACVSENAAADLVRQGGRADRIRIVPNGVDFERFAGAAPHPLPFEPDAFVVTFSGLFYPWHGVGFLAKAFVRLHSEVPTARLVLIGDGEYAPHVRRILREGGALDATLMPGLVPRDEVPGWLAAGDVLVSPHAAVRDFIGSPIKVFEYMAAGRAIVASRLAQIAEILSDGETALLVEPEDVDGLAEALLRLHRDRELGARLGGAAQEAARTQHSWDARVVSILGEGAENPSATD